MKLEVTREKDHDYDWLSYEAPNHSTWWSESLSALHTKSSIAFDIRGIMINCPNLILILLVKHDEWLVNL